MDNRPRPAHFTGLALVVPRGASAGASKTYFIGADVGAAWRKTSITEEMGAAR
jgi:hypothetical protein